MNKEDNRILLDIRKFADSNFKDLPVDFTLTEAEKKAFPNLIEFTSLDISAKVTAANEYFTVSLFAKGEAKVKDAHGGEIRTLPIEDGVDVLIAPSDLEQSDILPDVDGVYDLRGSILAVLFDAIPDTYSETPFERVETEDYVLMSQEEYEKIRKQREKEDNPFASLDAEDFE